MVLRFKWNDAVLEAEDGDSIAAALTAHDIARLGSSRTGRARGVFCGMGICHECLVQVNGSRSERACMVEVRDGMEVCEQNDADTPCHPISRLKCGVSEIEKDVVIVGAGPAGLNAGTLLDSWGCSVCVVDEREQPGGQYYKPRTPGFRGRHSADLQHREGDSLRRRAAASAVDFRFGCTAWYAHRESDESKGAFQIRATSPDRTLVVRARVVIVAAGAMETPAILPGWTMPGVMTLGAAQTFARKYGVLPGKRILVASNGPLGMQLAAELLVLGANVVALAERGRPRNFKAMLDAATASPRLVATGLSCRLRLFLGGAEVNYGWEVSGISGQDRVENVLLRRIEDGNERSLVADTVCIGDGFASQSELARQLGVPVSLENGTCLASPNREQSGKTSVEGVWVVGDAGGLKGAQWAVQQGMLAAQDIASYLEKQVAAGKPMARRVDSIDSFQKALWTLYRAPVREIASGSTLICRCEEVTCNEVLASIRKGAADLGSIKRATRLGMGRCQGRYCTAPALQILHDCGTAPTPERLMAPQLPARPVRISRVAKEKPEWRGHSRTTLASRPTPVFDQPIHKQSADLVVIGGGITGIIASLHAARMGAEVVCLERGMVNGEASGGNAGSLHLQLLSWDFGAKAVSDHAPLSTLPFQKEAIDLWISLQQELKQDFEISLTGGLMVAESDDQVAHLKSKVRAELNVGIDVEVIGAREVRQIVPGISDRIVGASWCPGEGKINPLTASIALWDAARASGAVFEECAPVTGLSRSSSGYQIETPRGGILARKILIAAGGWSGEVAKSLGVTLPVDGAPIQIIVTEAAPDLVPCMMAHADRHITMKQSKAGNVLIGGAWTAGVDREGRPIVRVDSLEGNLWVAERIVPGVGELSFIRSWAAMNIDIDGAPLISSLPDHPDVVVVASANGYTLAPILGKEAAKLALTGKPRRDLLRFGLERFG